MSTRLPSRSELEATACLFRLDKIYNHGVVDESDEARRGSIFHDAHKYYVRELAKQRLTADEGIANDAIDYAVRQRAAAPAVVDEATELFLHRFAPRFELDVDAFYFSEQRQADHDVSWQPDLVYVRPHEVEIRDPKTHYVGFTDDRAREQNQARVYALQAMKQWPNFPVYKVTFDWVRLGFTATAIFTPADRPELERNLQRQIDIRAQAYATNEWPASIGSHCAYCRLVCPIADDSRRVPLRARSAFEAQAQAARLISLKQEAAALTKSVSAYCAIDGPLRVGDLEFAHRPTETKEWPAAKVLDALTDCGIEEEHLPLAVVRGSDLAKYFKAKKWVHVAKALEGLATIWRGSEFKAKKVGAVEAPEQEEGAA
jgi:hypothetical protein